MELSYTHSKSNLNIIWSTCAEPDSWMFCFSSMCIVVTTPHSLATNKVCGEKIGVSLSNETFTHLSIYRRPSYAFNRVKPSLTFTFQKVVLLYCSCHQCGLKLHLLYCFCLFKTPTKNKLEKLNIIRPIIMGSFNVKRYRAYKCLVLWHQKTDNNL